uniref:Uncharacterized protein n=1 Tax=uncultured alpha proteobacterium HF0130_06E21 TaxID=710808 RepID=E0XT01_9PROT|nr:hypothetical protein [uncultured alpha proteobacterium HF0130_06E21]
MGAGKNWYDFSDLRLAHPKLTAFLVLVACGAHSWVNHEQIPRSLKY